MFVDRVFLTLEAGNGGNGAVQWSRRKYVPKGGPSGGNGGAGGSIYCTADSQLNSLQRWTDAKVQRAEAGRSGGSEKSTGRSGNDLLLPVPLGTLIRDADTLHVLADLTEPGQQALLCRGGRGGRGNSTFTTSTQRAPYIRTEGEKGEGRRVLLELKSIADVGLVGFPNAGKSTLLNALTGAEARVGAYPFTTKAPNLGTMVATALASITIADIPGISEGAHLGRGLGLAFLRHIERTKVLLFVLSAAPVDGGEPWELLRQLREELGAYNANLLSRPHFIAVSKMDQEGALQIAMSLRERLHGVQSPIVEISSAQNSGLDALRNTLISLATQNDPHR